MFENHRKSLKIVSEASYSYILSWQKFMKMPKLVNLDEFWKPEAWSQTVLPGRSFLIEQKIGGKCQNWKIQMRHFESFSNIVPVIKWNDFDFAF